MSSNNLSTNIKKLRKKEGLSQEKLARLADVANNTIIKIEAGKNQNPTLDTLKKISKVFRVSVDELIKWKFWVLRQLYLHFGKKYAKIVLIR